MEEYFHTRIWKELPEPDNPFRASTCYCYGYNVFGDLITKASWPEYIYLLFMGEHPTIPQCELLEGLAVAIAHPGIRDYSVQAAMNGGAGGSTSASCLIAALAVGAGQLGGGHEVYLAMEYWNQCKLEISAWKQFLLDPPVDERADVWLSMEHPPGFDPHSATCSTPTLQTLTYLASKSPGIYLKWLVRHRDYLEMIAKYPLAMSGVAAATFADLGLNPKQGEMLYLLLRLPGAAVHALEQAEHGWKNFPFFSNALIVENDPGPKR